MGTYGGGLLKYDREYDRFQRFVHEDDNPESLSFNEVRVLFETADQKFYVGTDGGGLNLMDRKKGTFKTFEHHATDSTSISHNNVLGISEAADNNLYVGTWIGLNLFDQQTQKFKRIRQSSPNAAHYYPPQLEYYENLLISNSKIYSLDGSGNFKSIDIGFEQASHIKKDHKGNCWLVENGQIAILNSKLERKHLIDVSQRFKLPPLYLNRIFHSKNSKSTWLLDWSGNFFHIKETPRLFEKFLESANEAKIHKTNSNYWVFDGGSIFIYEKESLNLLKVIPNFKGRTHITSKDKSQIWVVDNDHIYQFSEDGSELQKTKRKEGETFDALITTNGTLWTGEVLGVRIYDPATERTTYFDCDRKDPTGIGYFHRGNVVFEDYKNDIWIGTDGDGLKKYLPTNQEFEHHRHIIGDTTTINNNFINAIFEDRENTLWIGTDSGLCSYNEDENTFTPYNHPILKDKIIKSIQQDQRGGNLWIGTPNGLVKFNIKNNEVRILNEQDGLISHKISLSSTLLDYGNLVFSTENGLMTFNPQLVRPSQEVPSVYLSNLWVNNEAVQPESDIFKKSIEVEDQLNLAYTDRKIELEFQAVQYVNTQRCQYSYKLEGFDSAWTIANGTKATYTNLPAGTYTFLVKASNEDGVWNDEVTSLKINIKPPFWQLLWVQLLFAFFLLLIFAFIVRSIISRERHRSKFELEKQKVYQFEELAKMKLRFFTNISHELRTPLTLIASPPLDKFIQLGKKPDSKVLQMMYRNSNRLLELVNQILDFRKLENNQELRVKSQQSLSVFKNIYSAYSYWSKEKAIKFSLSLPQNDFGGYFDSDVMEKIVSNLISNAFKFTPYNGQIALKTNYDKIELDENRQILRGFLKIEVIDNGSGIPLKYQKKVFERFYQLDENPDKGYSSGIGLSLISELVELHKGSIELSSEEGKGSHFTIHIPVGYQNYGIMSEVQQNLPVEGDKQNSVILIIEDNDDIRNYLQNELNDEYDVLLAENGKEGFSLALQHLPDIVISDIMMPQSDGIQVANQLRSNELTAHIPIMFLTAKTGPKNILEGLSAGAEDYIQKPFNISELKLKIQNRFESRKLLIAKFQNKGLTYPSGDKDALYLDKVNKAIDKQINHPEFSISLLCDELSIGRSQLYRKIQALTGKAIIEYITSYKLSKAMHLLKENKLSIKEIAFEVGYNDNRYFSRVFKKRVWPPASFYKRNKRA